MTETLYNRASLLEILHLREATIKFRKVDGSLRTMQCTLNQSLIPPPVVEKTATTTSTRKQSEDIITVFDTEKQDWRSFRLDSIIEVA